MMKKYLVMGLFFLFILIPLFSDSSPSAGDWKSDLLSAEKHFHLVLEGHDENLSQAVRDYQSALRNGAPRDFRIYYNLGNALFLSGFPGEAALMYRRALFYKPNDRKIRQNLNYILNQSGLNEESTSGIQMILFGSIYLINYEASFYAGLFLFALSWGIAIARLLSGKRFLLPVFLSLLILSLWNTGLCFLWQYNGSHTGVIVSNEIILRKGDSEAYEPVLQTGLSAGMQFHLLEERQGWVYIRLSDKNQGWVEKDDIRMVL